VIATQDARLAPGLDRKAGLLDATPMEAQ